MDIQINDPTETTVVTTQPTGQETNHRGGSKFVPRPRGLQALESYEEIEICQVRDAVEIAFCCCERPDRYQVFAKGCTDPFLFIREVTQCYARSCLGAARDFAAKIRDTDDVDVASVNRPMTCSRGCIGFCCCMPEMWLYFPPPFKPGSVRERRSCCRPTFDILNSSSDMVFSFDNDCCYLQACGWFLNPSIQVHDSDGKIVSSITKGSYKNAEELLGLQNKYSIKYSPDLPIRDKLLIITACLLFHLNNFAENKRYCA